METVTREKKEENIKLSGKVLMTHFNSWIDKKGINMSNELSSSTRQSHQKQNEIF